MYRKRQYIQFNSREIDNVRKQLSMADWMNDYLQSEIYKIKKYMYLYIYIEQRYCQLDKIY